MNAEAIASQLIAENNLTEIEYRITICGAVYVIELVTGGSDGKTFGTIYKVKDFQGEYFSYVAKIEGDTIEQCKANVVLRIMLS